MTMDSNMAIGAIAALEPMLFRVPLDKPRINSFGKMTHRPALVVRLTDEDGVEGWGEAFCNWPAFAAEHRFRILSEILAPLLIGRAFESPSALSCWLTDKVRILRLQCDEQGPFDQSIAAIDIAAWDLASRRAGLPLHQLLGAPQSTSSVPYYASGISGEQALSIAEAERNAGTRAFKSKVGFGLSTDLTSIRELREVIGPDAELMVDVNQKWDMAGAREALAALAPYQLDWVEEPIPADHPASDFAELAGIGPPLAAGENVRGDHAFDEMTHKGGLRVLQPDIIKWGGITACSRVGRKALAAGLRYCPHYLGGGIGLLATAHLLAAVGGDGLLELDATPNILRSMLADPFPTLSDGQFHLPDGPGLGVVPDLRSLRPFLEAG